MTTKITGRAADVESKITIESCVIKNSGESKTGPYTVYTVKDITGTFYQSFEEFTAGEEVSVVITADITGKYNATIKRPKVAKPRTGGKFVPNDTKRETALLCAVKFHKPLASADVLKLADKYYNWLKSS